MVMTATAFEIPGPIVLEPEVYEDARGDFFEAWNRDDFAATTGFAGEFVQDNQSRSRAGVVRGLHYQLPNPQGKLVRVLTGAAFVVAVDIRLSSPTYTRWVSIELSADNRRQLWVPPGFAHGFLAQSDPTDVLYKVTAFYAPGCDRVIRWNDPGIGIKWPIGEAEPLLSDKDRTAPLLGDAEVFD